MKQTLLTGFGPFGEVVSNPSERLLHEFLGGTLHDQEITTALFPTQYAGTAERLKALFEVGGREGVPFENVLMLGVATGRGVWSVERYAHNRIEAKQDASGFTPQASQIVHGQPETLATRADIERLVMRLEASSIPAAPSDSAGEYLCNYLYYHALHLSLSESNINQCVFLHVPADPFTMAIGAKPVPTFPFDKHILAVEVVLEVLGVSV